MFHPTGGRPAQIVIFWDFVTQDKDTYLHLLRHFQPVLILKHFCGSEWHISDQYLRRLDVSQCVCGWQCTISSEFGPAEVNGTSVYNICGGWICHHCTVSQLPLSSSRFPPPQTPNAKLARVAEPATIHQFWINSGAPVFWVLYWPVSVKCTSPSNQSQVPEHQFWTIPSDMVTGYVLNPGYCSGIWLLHVKYLQTFHHTRIKSFRETPLVTGDQS